jgi:hypothetical protein
MFPTRYFADAYFAPRYFAKVGATPAAPTGGQSPAATRYRGSYRVSDVIGLLILMVVG